ncbi:uncharacterized protein BHQ10_002681 [Talaromyces amestolkiae]|uniref:Uncharacterized protein n=1 Tax=Talaromyces amestolkiae TaxID=1196081 RepID=A0A364KT01_TALAM|nr:uncharacterized protein BHQ10_002681 [Talaromyces amestolkiae]RAO66669.1 hypothetical protein BHQ10_002681 [Talaromyces amestolkiae]
MTPNPEQRRRQECIKFQPTKPYTRERLEQAIRVFGRHKPVATRKQSYAIGDFAACYNLRKRNASQLREIDMDIPDDDENDDNYEPSTPRTRRRRAIQPQSSTPVEPAPASRIVKLSFSSVRGKSLLLQLKHADVFRDFVDSDDDEIADAPSSTKNDSKDTAQEDVSMEDSEGIERIIITAFAHPIDCELGNNCGSPCDFCTDFTFGMFGLGIKTVSVIDHVTWFEELCGGHRDDGQEPTRMCNVCALTRLHIMNCGGHQVTAIPNYDPYTFNIQTAFNSLGGRRLRGRRHQINEWCSFCINPAFFRCSTTQIIDIFANDIEDPSSPEAQGCGLRLCQGCKDLMDEHRNDFDRVIAALPGATEKRADAEFLVNGSDLNRYFSE